MTYVDELTENLSENYMKKTGYHFRMNLSYFFPSRGSITKETLKKVTEIGRELINAIFTDAENVVFIQYVSELKELAKVLKPQEIIKDEYFSTSLAVNQYLGTTDCILRRVVYHNSQRSFLVKVVKSLIYTDFQLYNSVACITNSTILVNPEREIALHIYDDRGCDLFCQNKADFLVLKAQFQVYIESYDNGMRSIGYEVIYGEKTTTYRRGTEVIE